MKLGRSKTRWLMLFASSGGMLLACGDEDGSQMGQTIAGASGGAPTAGGGAGGRAGAGAAGRSGAAGGGAGISAAGRGGGGAGRMAAAGGGAPEDAGVIDMDDAGSPPAAADGFSFFVSSQKNMTGNLGGLSGADQRCQTLAAAVGQGAKTWHAYLSVARDPANGNMPAHARARIGAGPWFNAKGAMIAANLSELHTRRGDAELFVDERGTKINGQWQGSPTPIEHDVLTGSTAEGMLMADMNCRDWTSTANADVAQVGHSDGLGPNRDDQPPRSSWNSAHANGGCADTAPRGGAGRIYCFAVGGGR